MTLSLAKLDPGTIVRVAGRAQRLDPSKPLLIILEGGDKVGKSTIYQQLRRRTNYGPLVIDRFTGSNIVYDTFYERGRDIQEYYSTEDAINSIFNVVVFVLVCHPATQLDRIEREESDEMIEVVLSNFAQVNLLFRHYSYRTRYPFSYLVDTTGVTAEEVVELMLHELEVLGYVRE